MSEISGGQGRAVGPVKRWSRDGGRRRGAERIDEGVAKVGSLVEVEMVGNEATLLLSFPL